MILDGSPSDLKRQRIISLPVISMILDGSPSDLKRQRQAVCAVGEDSPITMTSVNGGAGVLPSKEAVASKGLEAKVDMATYGQSSWALTSLAAWRNNSLSSDRSAQFVRGRQREARRAMLGGAANVSAGGGGGTGPEMTAAAAAVPATAMTSGRDCCEMTVEETC